MDYTRGYKASFYAMLLDPVTWLEIERIELISGSISRSNGGLEQTASLTVRDFDQEQEHWIRVYMDATQEADVDHVALFTGLVSAPKENVEGPVATHELECYSVLEPLDVPLLLGEYIPYGMNAGTAIKRLLKPTPAPVDIAPGAPALEDYIVAEENETNVTMIQKVLDAIGWQMVIEGDGTIEVRPRPETVAASFSAIGMDVIEKTLSKTRDWFKTPNVFRATSGDMVAIARDDDPESPLSTVARGREVTSEETDVTLTSDEGLAEYAKRRLKEEQQIVESADYTRRFIPGVMVGDRVDINYDHLQGEYKVISQNITLTYNAQTEEQVERISDITRRGLDIVPIQKWAALIMPNNLYLVMPDGNRLLLPYKTIITN